MTALETKPMAFLGGSAIAVLSWFFPTGHGCFFGCSCPATRTGGSGLPDQSSRRRAGKVCD
jgi:hypothetical protein